METYFDNKILYEAIVCNIIDVDDLRNKLNAMKKQKILSTVHKNKIWQTQSMSKGKIYNYWCTYLPDKNTARGLRKIKRSTKEALEDAIIDFYNNDIEEKENLLFKNIFNHWVDFKKNLVSDNTIYRYSNDYIRFFKDSTFENMRIDEITEEDIIIFLSNTIKRLNLSVKAFKTLCGYIKECFESATSNHLIERNPYIFVKTKLKLLCKQCAKTKPKDIEEKTMSTYEINALLDKFHEDYIKKPWYITPYAVEFAILTGCRVGEIAALRWSDIDGDIITIRYSEKAHRIKGRPTVYSIEDTKTGKERKIPVTEEIKDLLYRVKVAEINNNSLGEFVFSDTNGRILASNISNCIRKKCNQVGIATKSIYSCRRTVNSTLRCLGVSSTVAASLMGHMPEVNDNHYTYDVSNLDEKRKMLEKANRIVLAK